MFRLAYKLITYNFQVKIISSTFVNIQHHQVIKSILSHRGPKVVFDMPKNRGRPV